ncbi:MAG: patatin-like phospholipase family protein [Gammaproteobacteria bacterium]|nr:patatin-like phospholipase family protein [Gammaproteobacteria bacterium]MBT8443510.1 patatin-like phospholipase family protein [Gammaproteobacteria bacterium]NND37879.1 serine protease [Gammaproteobacteria bacterium]
MTEEKKTISLVLGSGGARGLAHIGIIHWLEEHGYEIRSISGCSMGALIGGIYACGKLDAYTEWVRAIDKLDIVRLLDIAWGKAGLVEGDRIFATLAELIGDRQIEDLPIRFTAVAADISREKEVWITKGSVFDAIRASISLPLFFTPVERDGMTLLDGGVLNPVPIAPTFDDKTDLTIAVNLGGPPLDKPRREPKRPVAKTDDDDSFLANMHDRISVFIDDLSDRIQDNSNDWAALDIANQTFDAMQGAIARQKLAAYPPDITIEIPRNACGTLEFDRADEIIELGRTTAESKLGSLD